MKEKEKKEKEKKKEEEEKERQRKNEGKGGCPGTLSWARTLGARDTGAIAINEEGQRHDVMKL